jgi:hypothetical protein
MNIIMGLQLKLYLALLGKHHEISGNGISMGLELSSTSLLNTRGGRASNLRAISSLILALRYHFPPYKSAMQFNRNDIR